MIMLSSIYVLRDSNRKILTNKDRGIVTRTRIFWNGNFASKMDQEIGGFDKRTLSSRPTSGTRVQCGHGGHEQFRLLIRPRSSRTSLYTITKHDREQT